MMLQLKKDASEDMMETLFVSGKGAPSLKLQGVPKVCSSNFMHFNFWPKLYFYMKFLEDVYFSVEYMYP